MGGFGGGEGFTYMAFPETWNLSWALWVGVRFEGAGEGREVIEDASPLLKVISGRIREVRSSWFGGEVEVIDAILEKGENELSILRLLRLLDVALRFEFQEIKADRCI